MHDKFRLRIIKNHSEDIAKAMREAVKKSFEEDGGEPAHDDFINLVERETREAVFNTEVRDMNGQLPKKTPNS